MLVGQAAQLGARRAVPAAQDVSVRLEDAHLRAHLPGAHAPVAVVPVILVTLMILDSNEVLAQLLPGRAHASAGTCAQRTDRACARRAAWRMPRLASAAAPLAVHRRVVAASPRLLLRAVAGETRVHHLMQGHAPRPSVRPLWLYGGCMLGRTTYGIKCGPNPNHTLSREPGVATWSARRSSAAGSATSAATARLLRLRAISSSSRRPAAFCAACARSSKRCLRMRDTRVLARESKRHARMRISDRSSMHFVRAAALGG